MSKNCECGTDKPVIARGMCKKCYDKWYNANKDNPEIRTQRNHKRKAKKDTSLYPIPHVVTIWECSDGREFSNEVEACRYELDLFKRG